MSVLPAQRLSLEEAIAQQINLGHNDPLTIARKCADLYGTDWVAEELASHWQEILAEIARQKLGNERRAAIVTLATRAREGKVSKREAVISSLFVPGKGWISFGDATADDLVARESYLRRLADGLNRWADYYAAVRAELETQGVARVRDLKGALPDLPAAEIEAGS